MVMCKKVNLSISPEVDAFLTEMKEKHGISKSKVLTAMVMQYGNNVDKRLSQISKKGDTIATVSTYQR